jgi:hypothetical protein
MNLKVESSGQVFSTPKSIPRHSLNFRYSVQHFSNSADIAAVGSCHSIERLQPHGPDRLYFCTHCIIILLLNPRPSSEIIGFELTHSNIPTSRFPTAYMNVAIHPVLENPKSIVDLFLLVSKQMTQFLANGRGHEFHLANSQSDILTFIF